MVFYADDDSDDLDLFLDIAGKIGRKVVTFDHGASLMHRLKNPPPVAGILFLDINMPGISGFDVLAEIRSSEKWKELPIVMLSTADDSTSIEKCMDLGANLYIRKANSYDKLEKSVRYALSIDWKHRDTTRDNFVVAA